MTGQRPVIFPSAGIRTKVGPRSLRGLLCTEKSGDTMQPANCFRTGSVI